ncbi:glutathione peroxidase [Pseudomonas oryzihabitans]|uniref:Glutathione peroxidase n=1 Tax=Pseudomonas oryzihabitans TaxID=47885 RepID=A0AAJ2BGY9_9PSED|nr:glutathione peroxidase [Pseudomonas psychrotolerans]MDR6353342.1 glutathione peroxidase [Pseudomonas psychrotolerans]
MTSEILHVPFKMADGQSACLADWPARAYLVVNTASRCGFTQQYAGLEELQQRYRADGLRVIVFPCNQFGNQEPEGDAQIQTFCLTRFNVSFPVMAKIDVNGDEAHPLFTALKRAAPGLLGTAIRWNFTKFLVSPAQDRVRRFAPVTKPLQLEKHLQRALGR